MKIVIIIAAALLVLGIIISAIGTISYFSKGDNAVLTTNTHEITEKFTRLTIDTETADVTLALSEDGACRVVCREDEKIETHAVKVEEGTLFIECKNLKKWYHYVIPHFSHSPEITVYLPQSALDSLSVDLSTGDITVPEGFSFGEVALTHSTGAIHFDSAVTNGLSIKGSTGHVTLGNGAAVGGDLVITQTTGHANIALNGESREIKITTDTGKIALSGATAQKIDLKASTGDVKISNTVATESLAVETSTGDVTLESVDAPTIEIETDTGDVKGTLRSEKIFFVETSTGKIDVPRGTSGGTCDIETSTGNVTVTIE